MVPGNNRYFRQKIPVFLSALPIGAGCFPSQRLLDGMIPGLIHVNPKPELNVPVQAGLYFKMAHILGDFNFLVIRCQILEFWFEIRNVFAFDIQTQLTR